MPSNVAVIQQHRLLLVVTQLDLTLTMAAARARWWTSTSPTHCSSERWDWPSTLAKSSFCSATIRTLGRRVDSSFLLPSAARCLIKNVTRPKERDEWQIEEATERGNEAGTD